MNERHRSPDKDGPRDSSLAQYEGYVDAAHMHEQAGSPSEAMHAYIMAIDSAISMHDTKRAMLCVNRARQILLDNLGLDTENDNVLDALEQEIKALKAKE